MKKKSKKPKEVLIKSVLDDLKSIPEDSSFAIAPEGLGDDATATRDAKSKSESEPTFILGSDSENTLEKKSESSHMAFVGDQTELAGAHRRPVKEAEPKISFGAVGSRSSVYEAQFAQAENLKLAQQRILDLEREVERLRKDNELIASSADISRQRMDELVSQLHSLERQKHELKAVSDSELQIFKEGLAAKDSEILRLRSKVDELESRLANDLKKVRVRERELENRLELSKAEKTALLRAKDENILELKRKTENLESEIETYQNKIIELGQKIELNQEQFARTVRALRLALTNLEVSDGTSSSITLAPLKKAE